MSVRRIFRLALLVFGVMATLLGIWWVLQGTGVVPIGFMANHMQWAWRGLVLIATGLAIAVAAARMAR